MDAAPLEVFEGVVDVVEGGVAFLTMRSLANGDVMEGSAVVEELASHGIHEGGHFRCSTYDTPGGVIIRFEPIEPRRLSDEEVERFCRKVDLALTDDDLRDDY